MSLTKEDVSRPMNELLDHWQSSVSKEFVPKSEPRIKVNEVVSKLAFVYEKIRYTVDFKEEHLIRKSAIERILKMRIVRERKDSRISKSLLMELIRGGYLPNNEIPETKIEEVSKILDKYVVLLNNSVQYFDNAREYSYWLMGLAAAEIEEFIVPSTNNQAMAATMYQVLNSHSVIKKGKIDKQDKEILLYTAVYKSLLKYDKSWLEYVLWKLYMPNWTESSLEEVQKMAANTPGIREGMQTYLKHPRLESFSRVCRKYTVIFSVIQDLYVRETGKIYDILRDPKLLEEKVSEVCQERYKQAHIKLRRSAIRSILYIFVTKMGLALFLEFPYDRYIINDVNYLALGFNIVIPPLLMFFSALMIRVPSDSNTKKIIRGVRTIVYSKKGEEIPIVFRRLERSIFLKTLFGFVYAFMFLFSFGFIVTALRLIDFNVLSISLFLFFISVVSFFAFRIRQTAREMVIEGKRDRIRTVLMDFISIPFLRAGRFLSTTFSRVNFFMFVFDFIIEAPFKSFIEIFEELLTYIKEKKEDV